jgi:ribosome recycling factor
VRDARLKEISSHMDKSVEAVRHEFNAIRTGKASPALLDLVRVEAYGTTMPLNQLASISAPEPRFLVVQPYDPSQIGAIEKALLASDLGLTPSNDGRIIRLPIPPLTEERRKELVKVAHKVAEEGRVAVRNIRHDANKKAQAVEKEGEISQDEAHRLLKEIQALTDEHVKKIDEVLHHKEQEILEV